MPSRQMPTTYTYMASIISITIGKAMQALAFVAVLLCNRFEVALQAVGNGF